MQTRPPESIRIFAVAKRPKDPFDLAAYRSGLRIKYGVTITPVTNPSLRAENILVHGKAKMILANTQIKGEPALIRLARADSKEEIRALLAAVSAGLCVSVIEYPASAASRRDEQGRVIISMAPPSITSDLIITHTNSEPEFMMPATATRAFDASSGTYEFRRG
jgi:hypothetical protein